MPSAELEFMRLLNLIDNDVETAFITFQSYEELNLLALEDEEIRGAPYLAASNRKDPIHGVAVWIDSRSA